MVTSAIFFSGLFRKLDLLKVKILSKSMSNCLTAVDHDDDDDNDGRVCVCPGAKDKRYTDVKQYNVLQYNIVYW